MVSHKMMALGDASHRRALEKLYSWNVIAKGREQFSFRRAGEPWRQSVEMLSQQCQSACASELGTSKWLRGVF